MSTDGLIVLEDATGSPVSRVKFLCSHGGKILPRPTDGQLKYVGGETRVISVPRDIKFSELLKKLTFYIEDEMILKYQLLPEDLDALVSVRNDEDLQHMFNEHDLYETAGSLRLRSFLFPAKPVVLENQAEAQAIEQRYIDAINGVVRPPSSSSSPALLKSNNYQAPSVINSFHGALGMSSSACSSPQSPDSCNMDGGGSGHEGGFHNNHHGGAARSNLHRVHSSPSVGNLVGLQQWCPCGHSHHQQQQYPQNPQNYYQTVRAQNQSQNQHQHQHQGQGQYPSRPPIDHHKGGGGGGSIVGPGPERLISVRSVGRAEGARYQVDYAPPAPSQLQSLGPRYNNSGSRGGCCPNSKCMHSDEYNNGHGFDRRGERSSSLSPSPMSLSPRYSHSHMVGRQWDAAVAGDS